MAWLNDEGELVEDDFSIGSVLELDILEFDLSFHWPDLVVDFDLFFGLLLGADFLHFEGPDG